MNLEINVSNTDEPHQNDQSTLNSNKCNYYNGEKIHEGSYATDQTNYSKSDNVEHEGAECINIEMAEKSDEHDDNEKCRNDGNEFELLIAVDNESHNETNNDDGITSDDDEHNQNLRHNNEHNDNESQNGNHNDEYINDEYINDDDVNSHPEVNEKENNDDGTFPFGNNEKLHSSVNSTKHEALMMILIMYIRHN